MSTYLTRADLDIPAGTPAERTPTVTLAELARLDGEGSMILADHLHLDPWALDQDQVRHALAVTRRSWGGATFKRRGGTYDYGPTPREAYAVAVGGTVSAPIGDEGALARILATFATTVSHIGVFRDDERGTIDVDPVVIVDTLDEANALAVHCRATGGSYNFADELGYWTPTAS